MDVLLVDPPQMTLKGQVTTRGYNLGLTSLAAYLRKEGIDTGILMGDLSVEVPSGNIIKSILPDWLTISTKDLALGQRTLEKIAKDTNHKIWKTIADKVRQIMPTTLGISYYTPLKPVEDLIVSLVKDINQDIKIIAGSFHATFCPDELMQNPNIDFVVRGEGEIPLTSLIKEIKKDRPKWENVPGTLYRDLDGQIKSNPSVGMIDNLDDLPFPARDLVLECDYNRYNHHSLITARGCPYSCAFCGDKRLWGGTVRRRSVDNVIEEIKLLKDTYKIKYVEIVDGTFTYDRKYLQEFCNAMIDNALGVKWGCTARYDNLDKEILSLMKKADCYGLYLGLESGSNRVLESINKKETIERNIEVSKMIYDSGIIQATSILLGSPDEQKEDIEETLKVMKNLETDFFDVNSYMPLPGTPFYDAMTEQERQAIDWSKVGLKSYGNYFSRHMTKSELESYQNQAYEIANSKRKKSIIKLVFKRVIESITKPFKK